MLQGSWGLVISYFGGDYCKWKPIKDNTQVPLRFVCFRQVWRSPGLLEIVWGMTETGQTWSSAIHSRGCLRKQPRGMLSPVRYAEGTLDVLTLSRSLSFWLEFFPLKQVAVAGWGPMGALCRHTLWRTSRWIRPMTAIPGRPFCAMPKLRKTTRIGFLRRTPSKEIAF